MGSNDDTFNLQRFMSAQEPIYARVLDELRNGQKVSHWMWFIFPQIAGSGSSPTSRLYAISSLDEGKAYLAHEVLGARLVECARVLMRVKKRTASEIFGFPDDAKLQSSMTLFAAMGESDEVFPEVLDKYFNGERDEKTLHLLNSSL